MSKTNETSRAADAMSLRTCLESLTALVTLVTAVLVLMSFGRDEFRSANRKAAGGEAAPIPEPVPSVADLPPPTGDKSTQFIRQEFLLPADFQAELADRIHRLGIDSLKEEYALLEMLRDRNLVRAKAAELAAHFREPPVWTYDGRQVSAGELQWLLQRE